MFNPRTRPDRYWTDGPPNVVHTKKSKVTEVMHVTPLKGLYIEVDSDATGSFV
jgi:hypothetical protein